MTASLTPASEAEAADAIAAARAARTPFTIEGGGTRAGLGRPAQTELTLSTAGLSGITLYEPAELVIAAWAGTPLKTVVETLAAHNQFLPFEPMDHRPLLGTSGEPTIGAVAACNVSGPRRINAGAARDHLIGVRLVNGRGEIVKSGGRVMKNVTGLDLVKLSSGAYGTLGLLTEVTFKVLPRPATSTTLMLRGLDDATAVAAMSAALGSPYEIMGAAHLPAGLAEPEAMTLLRFEGAETSVAYRGGALAALLQSHGAAEAVAAERAAALWRDIRDVVPLATPRDAAVWRLSVAPSRAAGVIAAIRRASPARHLLDWGGGLIWLSVAAAGDAGAETIRAAVHAAGGHATLVRAAPELRARVPVFEPLDAALMKITSGLKASFDPDRIVNPGLMYAGI
jgi:glycolate oxidase FAD binding subunit